MTLQSWFESQPDKVQAWLLILSGLAAILAIAFCIVYYRDMRVVTTCYSFGSVVPCPL